ncbi:MAG: hypothetical protein HQK62_08695 [Desulfamplus sp.]|nr:hypothetical protein [Desulfamplus sp.]
MIATISGWLCIACLALTAMLEPTEPKKDGRFKTGYKNNAVKPVKSKETNQAQKLLLMVAAVSVVIWYLIRQ